MIQTRVNQFLVAYQKLVQELQESGDQLEFQDQIVQLSQESEGIVDEIYNLLQTKHEEIVVISRKIEEEENNRKKLLLEQEDIKALALELVKATGEEISKTGIKLASETVRFYKGESWSVRSNLTVKDVPSQFVKMKIDAWITEDDIIAIEKTLNRTLKIKSEIDKAALNTSAKEWGGQMQEKYLEKKEFLKIN